MIFLSPHRNFGTSNLFVTRVSNISRYNVKMALTHIPSINLKFLIVLTIFKTNELYFFLILLNFCCFGKESVSSFFLLDKLSRVYIKNAIHTPKFFFFRESTITYS